MNFNWSVSWPVAHGQNAHHHVYTAWKILVLEKLWEYQTKVSSKFALQASSRKHVLAKKNLISRIDNSFSII